LRRGFARGVRNLDDLARRLGRRLRFRRFSITRKGHWFQLWGHFNSRVLLATGEVRTVRGRARVGTKIQTPHGPGIVIGKGRGSSSFVREAQLVERRAGGLAENQQMYKRLFSATDDEARRAIIYNARNTSALRKGIPGPAAPPFYQAHHIAPRELLKTPGIRNFFKRIGFNIEDGLHNGVMLPPDAAARKGAAAAPWKNAAVHFGSHPEYTKRMLAEIERIRVRFETSVGRAGKDAAKAARQRALKEMRDLTSKTRQDLLKGTEILD
jgi:HNH/ENDO VII superfamily nuclease